MPYHQEKNSRTKHVEQLRKIKFFSVQQKYRIIYSAMYDYISKTKFHGRTSQPYGLPTRNRCKPRKDKGHIGKATTTEREGVTTTNGKSSCVDRGVRECLPFFKVLQKASRSTDKCVPFLPVDEQVPGLLPRSFLVDEHKPTLFQGVTKGFRVDQTVRECLSGAEKLPRQSTLLSQTKFKEPLYLYLVVSPTTISSALIQE